VDDNEASLRITAAPSQRQDELTGGGAIRGEEALVQVRDLRPQVILVGPDRPGLETISRLRKVLPGVGIIALTPLNDNACRQTALAAGADDLVPKAELTTKLLPAIRLVTQVNRRR